MKTTKAMTVDHMTAVYVSGDDIVLKDTDGRLRLLTLPPDAKLNVDGQDVAVQDLQPGTTISHAEIRTTHEEEVTTVTNVEGTVIRVRAPRFVTLQFDDHSVKQYRVPPHAKFMIDGAEKTVFDLRKGMKISATAVTTEGHNIHSTEHALSGSTSIESPAQSGVLLIFNHDEK